MKIRSREMVGTIEQNIEGQVEKCPHFEFGKSVNSARTNLGKLLQSLYFSQEKCMYQMHITLDTNLNQIDAKDTYAFNLLNCNKCIGIC